MLKFIYTETAVHLELLSVNLTDWVEHRRAFAATMGESISISPEGATFLLPELVCEVSAVNLYLHQAGVKSVNVHNCDLDYAEIALAGYWLYSHAPTDEDTATMQLLSSHEGIFITELPDRVESYLWQLWSDGNSKIVAGDGVVG